jgi:hypothetical protein
MACQGLDRGLLEIVLDHPATAGDGMRTGTGIAVETTAETAAVATEESTATTRGGASSAIIGIGTGMTAGQADLLIGVDAATPLGIVLGARDHGSNVAWRSRSM